MRPRTVFRTMFVFAFAMGVEILGCRETSTPVGEGDTDSSDSDTDMDVDTDVDTDTDADMDTDSDGDTDADTDGDTDADSDADTDGDSDADSDADTDSGTEKDSDTETVPLREPTAHREVALSCENVHSPAEPPSDAGGECSIHADCASGTNGKCVNGVGMMWDEYFCVYDACASDAACGEGGVCHCSSGDAARCVTQGNCQVDADCGVGGYCSPSSNNNCGGYMTVTGYHCHTPDDKCMNSSDCGAGEFCNYNAYDNLWECEPLDNGCMIG